MMSKPVEGTPGTADWPGLLEHYRQTAVMVMASHRCVDTTCDSCGQPWPCRSACAAELALEL